MILFSSFLLFCGFGVDFGLFSGGDGFFGDFSCFIEGYLCEERSYELVDEDGEECNITDDKTAFSEGHCGERHTE